MLIDGRGDRSRPARFSYSDNANRYLEIVRCKSLSEPQEFAGSTWIAGTDWRNWLSQMQSAKGNRKTYTPGHLGD